MTTENLFEAAPDNSVSRFNAFESAVPSALKEFPIIVPEARPTSDGVSLYDPGQSQPFSITDDQGRVIATAPDSSDSIRDIANGGNDQSNDDVDGAATYGCSNCGCNEYAATGWNRNAFNAAQARQFSSYEDGDDGDDGDYDPGDDGGDCDPDDGGCGPGGGLLRGLLGRFGRGGLFGRLFGGLGGGMRFGRFMR